MLSLQVYFLPGKSPNPVLNYSPSLILKFIKLSDGNISDDTSHYYKSWLVTKHELK